MNSRKVKAPKHCAQYVERCFCKSLRNEYDSLTLPPHVLEMSWISFVFHVKYVYLLTATIIFAYSFWKHSHCSFAVSTFAWVHLYSSENAPLVACWMALKKSCSLNWSQGHLTEDNCQCNLTLKARGFGNLSYSTGHAQYLCRCRQ